MGGSPVGRYALFAARREADAWIISVEPELREEHLAALEAAVDAIPAGREPIVLDCTRCGYVGSEGVRSLTALYARLGTRLRIVVASSSYVGQLIRVIELSDALPVFPSLAAALASG